MNTNDYDPSGHFEDIGIDRSQREEEVYVRHNYGKNRLSRDLAKNNHTKTLVLHQHAKQSQHIRGALMQSTIKALKILFDGSAPRLCLRGRTNVKIVRNNNI